MFKKLEQQDGSAFTDSHRLSIASTRVLMTMCPHEKPQNRSEQSLCITFQAIVLAWCLEPSQFDWMVAITHSSQPRAWRLFYISFWMIILLFFEYECFELTSRYLFWISLPLRNADFAVGDDVREVIRVREVTFRFRIAKGCYIYHNWHVSVLHNPSSLPSSMHRNHLYFLH